MLKDMINSFNEEKIDKRSRKLERLLLLVIPYFYFIFGLFFYKSPNIEDPMTWGHRIFGMSIFLSLYILSFISSWVEKRLKLLTYTAAYFAIIHLAYVAYIDSYNYSMSVSLIVTAAIANLFFEGNKFIFYCNIVTTLFVAATVLLIEEPAAFRVSYFIMYFIIVVVTYLVSYQKLSWILLRKNRNYF
jgi:membrane-bound metal-dependent hydrolase YbcI (DUF457 family)